MDKKTCMFSNAQILWDYLTIGEDVKPATFILTLGNRYMRECAERSADLFHNGFGDFIVVTGGVKHTVNYKGKKVTDTEANILRRYLIDLDVPEEKIILENKARTTGCNFVQTRALLKEFNIKARTLIAVTKPYIERRALATSQRQTPLFDTQVTSFDEDLKTFYLRLPQDEREELINELVGTINRIHDYPHLGFQTHQYVPPHVEKAKKALEELGYKGNYKLNSERKRTTKKKLKKR